MKFYKETAWNLWAGITLLFMVTAALNSEVKNKRPIWNIAHMVNSISEVDFYLSKGANAIEFDIQFDSHGKAVYTHHGFPCDLFRKWWMWENIDAYLNKMRDLTTPGHRDFRKELVLLFLDLKVGQLTPQALKYASQNLATKLKNIYWKNGKSGAQAYVVLALPTLKQIKFAVNFMNVLQEENNLFYTDKIGFTFFGNKDAKTIRSELLSIEATHRIWQGDGITNWVPRGYERLRKILKIRNQGKSQYFNKVYTWTIDRMSTMREVLGMGVDAITTNYPDNLSAVLKEFSNDLRLADVNDSPWEKHPGNEIIPPVHNLSWLLDKLWQSEEL